MFPAALMCRFIPPTLSKGKSDRPRPPYGEVKLRFVFAKGAALGRRRPRATREYVVERTRRLEMNTRGFIVIAGLSAVLWTTAARAADHADGPAAKADPSADITDVFAWMSPDAQRV